MDRTEVRQQGSKLGTDRWLFGTRAATCQGSASGASAQQKRHHSRTGVGRGRCARMLGSAGQLPRCRACCAAAVQAQQGLPHGHSVNSPSVMMGGMVSGASRRYVMMRWIVCVSTCLSVASVSSRSAHQPSRKFSAMILRDQKIACLHNHQHVHPQPSALPAVFGDDPSRHKAHEA